MGRNSAGILPFRVADGQVSVLLVHPGGPFWAGKDDGAWSVVKGEYAAGEEPRAAALREFREETGTDLSGVELVALGRVRQKGGKTVTAWAAETGIDPGNVESNSFEMEWPPRSGIRRQFPEIDRAEWYEADTARRKINPAQAELVDRLVALLRERGRFGPPTTG